MDAGLLPEGQKAEAEGEGEGQGEGEGEGQEKGEGPKAVRLSELSFGDHSIEPGADHGRRLVHGGEGWRGFGDNATKLRGKQAYSQFYLYFTFSHILLNNLIRCLDF